VLLLLLNRHRRKLRHRLQLLLRIAELLSLLRLKRKLLLIHHALQSKKIKLQQL
jgi:hypothetical protein